MTGEGRGAEPDPRHILREALEAIARERPHFDGVDPFVDRVVEAWAGPGFAGRIEAASRDFPWPVVADLLSLASWVVPREVESDLFRETRSWLAAADDERRSGIALNLDVVPLARPEDEADRELALKRLAERFPNLHDRYRQLLASLAAARTR